MMDIEYLLSFCGSIVASMALLGSFLRLVPHHILKCIRWVVVSMNSPKPVLHFQRRIPCKYKYKLSTCSVRVGKCILPISIQLCDRPYSPETQDDLKVFGGLCIDQIQSWYSWQLTVQCLRMQFDFPCLACVISVTRRKIMFGSLPCNFPISLAGDPATMTLEGTDFKTREPAATIAPFPMVILPRMVAAAPIKTLSLTLGCLSPCSLPVPETKYDMINGLNWRRTTYDLKLKFSMLHNNEGID